MEGVPPIPDPFLLGSMVTRLLLGLALAASASAQSADRTVAGTVRDSSGAVIPGARLEALNTRTGVLTRTTTNEQGVYSFASLNTGTYRLAAMNDGFKSSAIDNLRLEVGARLSLDLTLEVATAGTQLEVVATEAKLDLSQAYLSAKPSGSRAIGPNIYPIAWQPIRCIVRAKQCYTASGAGE